LNSPRILFVCVRISFTRNGAANTGHDLEDWLRAEAEILGKKPAAAGEAKDSVGGSRAAAA